MVAHHLASEMVPTSRDQRSSRPPPPRLRGLLSYTAASAAVDTARRALELHSR
jgi:hypothetical protein